MSFRLTSDPSERIRKIEKILLIMRFVWRFPRVKGAWLKYEYIKPWLADLAPATVVDIGVNHGQFLHLASRLWPARTSSASSPMRHWPKRRTRFISETRKSGSNPVPLGRKMAISTCYDRK